jgi:hypothetical protein
MCSDDEMGLIDCRVSHAGSDALRSDEGQDLHHHRPDDAQGSVGDAAEEVSVDRHADAAGPRPAHSGHVRHDLLPEPGEGAGAHDLGPDAIRRPRHAPLRAGQLEPEDVQPALRGGDGGHDQHLAQDGPTGRDSPPLPVCELASKPDHSFIHLVHSR